MTRIIFKIILGNQSGNHNQVITISFDDVINWRGSGTSLGTGIESIINAVAQHTDKLRKIEDMVWNTLVNW